MLIRPTTEQHLTALMGWFEDKEACQLWGGPYFRYPYNINTFKEDIAWNEKPAFSLLNKNGELLGFGQIYIRGAHVHLARLVISPKKRGQGFGKYLIQALMTQSKDLFSCNDFSLFVYKHNLQAIKCYESQGFVIEVYPDGELFEEECLYMVHDNAV